LISSTGGHIEPVPHQEHRGVMLGAVVACDAIFRNHYVEIIEHRVARRRFDAAFRRASADHDRLDAVAAQEHVEVVPQKPAGAILRTTSSFSSGMNSRANSCPGRTGNRIAQWRLVGRRASLCILRLKRI